MGKKKPFIDKKRSSTYHLVYQPTTDVNDATDRVLVDSNKGVGIGKVDTEAAAAAQASASSSGRRFPPSHPLAWMYEEPEDLSIERRRELIEMGFPDDGYDYFKHMRTAEDRRVTLAGESKSEGNAQDEETVGPSVFIPASVFEPPPEDRKAYDATGLRLHQPATTEAEADQLLGGVLAFSRERRAVRGSERVELEEVEALMRRYEDWEAVEGGQQEGLGDLLDDFVVTALQDGSGGGRQGGGGGAYPEQEEEEEEEYNEFSEEYSGDERFESSDEDEVVEARSALAAKSANGEARPGSIASTYWRPERTDRKENLSMIDERFEQLALQYDEDEIGSLEDEVEDIKGERRVDEFQGVMEEFLDKYRDSSGVGVVDVGAEEREARAACQKARELVALMEEGGGGGRGSELLEVAAPDPSRDWDCESVLSLRSNLDNHPARIDEPRSCRAAAQQPLLLTPVRLSEQHGIPLGYTQRNTLTAPSASSSLPSSHAGPSISSRSKHESAEEKRERKAAVKAARREARAAKKDMKTAFKSEAVRFQRQAASALPGGMVLE